MGAIVQICPGLNTNEMHVPYDRHHKVSSLKKRSLIQICTFKRRFLAGKITECCLLLDPQTQNRGFRNFVLMALER